MGWLYIKQGLVFEGLFKNDQKVGIGKINFIDGSQIQGEWHEDHLLKITKY